MNSTKNKILLLLTPLLLLTTAAQTRAASNGVRDDGQFFSQGAITQAQQTIDQIERRHSKDVLVETLATVPDEQKTQLEQVGQDQQRREAVFARWADSRFKSQGVNGIYILITKTPPHLEVSLGNNTRKDRLFSNTDRDAVRSQLLAAFRQKNFDQGLTSAVQTISERMDANAPATGSGSARQSAQPSPTYTPPAIPRQQSRGWGFGSIACILIAVVLFIVLIRGIFGRSGGNYYGGGGYPQGGYQQGGYPPGGYPQGGGYGYGGGGGGGFGRGFLGGLLGGALGGYAADRWMNSGQQSGGSVPPASGGSTGGDWGGGSGAADTSSESSGGDFGGGGFGGGDSGGGGGGDWGGGGGGGDFGGGGGGDFGGGGSSGGDF